MNVKLRKILFAIPVIGGERKLEVNTLESCRIILQFSLHSNYRTKTTKLKQYLFPPKKQKQNLSTPKTFLQIWKIIAFGISNE